jgi:hypothetical protein
MLCAKWRPGKPRMKREAPMYIGTLEEVLFKPLSTSPLLPFTGWMLPESPERGETVPTGGNLFVFKMQLPGKSSPELGVVIQRAWRGPSAFKSSSACASRNLGSNLRVPKRLRTYSIFALYVCDGIEVGSRLLGDRVQAHDKKRAESATSGKQLAHWAPGLLNKLPFTRDSYLARRWSSSPTIRARRKERRPKERNRLFDVQPRLFFPTVSCGWPLGNFRFT